MVKWEELLEKIIPFVVVGGSIAFIISKIKPPPEVEVEIRGIEVA